MKTTEITANQWKSMNYMERLGAMTEEFKSYSEDNFKLFIAEYGWVDWMNAYTDVCDDEEPSNEEMYELNQDLKSMWKDYFSGLLD